MSNKNSIKDFYDNRGGKEEKADFWLYGRNKVLPEFFPPTQKNEKVLDVACGSGQIAGYFHSQGYKVWGIDISRKAIQKAKKLNIGEFKVADVEKKLQYKSSFFDIVFLGDIIEHLFDPQHLLEETHRVLKPEGKVVISCPNMGFWLYRWHYFKTGIFPNTEGHQVEPWCSGHIRFFTLKILKRLLSETGFEFSKVKGLKGSKRNWTFLSNYWPEIFSPIILVEGLKKAKRE